MKPKMSIREYFALEAMKSMLSNSKLVVGIELTEDPQVLALTSVVLADELLGALVSDVDEEIKKLLDSQSNGE